MVITGSDDNIATVFEVASGKELSHLPQGGPVRAVAFSPVGRFVATGSDDKTARVFEAASGKELSRLTEGGRVAAVAFSPDGRFVATGSDDTTARVFEAASGKELSRLTEGGRVAAVTFSPKDSDIDTNALITWLWPLRSIPRLILTANIVSDRSGIIVTREPLREEDLMSEACSRLTRNLTRDEWKQYLGDTPPQRTCPNLP